MAKKLEQLYELATQLINTAPFAHAQDTQYKAYKETFNEYHVLKNTDLILTPEFLSDHLHIMIEFCYVRSLKLSVDSSEYRNLQAQLNVLWGIAIELNKQPDAQAADSNSKVNEGKRMAALNEFKRLVLGNKYRHINLNAENEMLMIDDLISSLKEGNSMFFNISPKLRSMKLTLERELTHLKWSLYRDYQHHNELATLVNEDGRSVLSLFSEYIRDYVNDLLIASPNSAASCGSLPFQEILEHPAYPLISHRTRISAKNALCDAAAIGLFISAILIAGIMACPIPEVVQFCTHAADALGQLHKGHDVGVGIMGAIASAGITGASMLIGYGRFKQNQKKSIQPETLSIKSTELSYIKKICLSIHSSTKH